MKKLLRLLKTHKIELIILLINLPYILSLIYIIITPFLDANLDLGAYLAIISTVIAFIGNEIIFYYTYPYNKKDDN